MKVGDIVTDAERLSGRVAVVTGGAQGIGAAIATRLTEEGAAVGILDINADAADALAARLTDAGRRAVAVACDVRDRDAVQRAVAAIGDRFGGPDLVVNNAGINAYFDAVTMTEADWDLVFAIDLKAAWLVSQAALPGMLEAGRGSIVNISSIHAKMTSAGYFPYAAAKAGLEGLTRSLALEYGPQGIRVNVVAPGWTRTALADEWFQKQPDPAAAERKIVDEHPMRRIADPADIAAVVAFLCSDDARSMTGSTVSVDCGLSARFAS